MCSIRARTFDRFRFALICLFVSGLFRNPFSGIWLSAPIRVQ